MKIIGITGGIGSGKSTVSKLLDIMGIPVYIADKEAKKVMNNSPEIRTKLTQRFGEDIYAGNSLDSQKLASLIFSEPEAVLYVNSVVHPAVQADFSNWLKNCSSSIAAIESAILFESGFDSLVHYILSVSAPEEIRIEQAIKRDSSSRQTVKDRIRNQIPEEERNRRSDFILINNGRQALVPQTERILNLVEYR